MNTETYKNELISQLESSVAFLEHMLSKEKDPAEKAKLQHEWGSAVGQLTRAKAMGF